MRRPLAPLRTTAALALSLSFALTACGSEDPEAQPAEDSATTSGTTAGDEDSSGGTDDDGTPTESGDDTSDAPDPTATPTPDTKAGSELTPEEFAELLATSMERGGTARITMSGEGMVGISMQGVVDYTRDQPAMRLQMEGMPGQEGLNSEMIMVGGAVYTQMGDNGQYVKLDTGDLGDDIGQLDPGANLSNFSSGISELNYIGQENLDGETTHHYVAVINTASLGADVPEAAHSLEQLNYHVWLDTDDLVRKYRLELPQAGAGTMEMTFSGWGEPVDITAPPADRVTEMPKLPTSPNS